MSDLAKSAPLAAALLACLAACTSETLPPTANATPAPAVVTTAPVVAAVPLAPGTIVTAPAASAVMVPYSGSSVAVVPSRLGATEIAGLMAGSTAAGTTSDGAPYYVKFERSGNLVYRQGSNYQDTGRWRVTPDGQLCSALSRNNSGTEQCYTLYRGTSAGSYVYERPDGTPIGSFTVTPGV